MRDEMIRGSELGRRRDKKMAEGDRRSRKERTGKFLRENDGGSGGCTGRSRRERFIKKTLNSRFHARTTVK